MRRLATIPSFKQGGNSAEYCWKQTAKGKRSVKGHECKQILTTSDYSICVFGSNENAIHATIKGYDFDK
jgi:hypothetical protein